jgi:hypothetical protein
MPSTSSLKGVSADDFAAFDGAQLAVHAIVDRRSVAGIPHVDAFLEELD